MQDKHTSPSKKIWPNEKPERNQALIDDYRAGMSVQDLARKYGISVGTVRPKVERADPSIHRWPIRVRRRLFAHGIRSDEDMFRASIDDCQKAMGDAQWGEGVYHTIQSRKERKGEAAT